MPLAKLLPVAVKRLIMRYLNTFAGIRFHDHEPSKGHLGGNGELLKVTNVPKLNTIDVILKMKFLKILTEAENPGHLFSQIL